MRMHRIRCSQNVCDCPRCLTVNVTDTNCRVCGDVTNNAEPLCHVCDQELAADLAERDRCEDTPPDSNATLGLREGD